MEIPTVEIAYVDPGFILLDPENTQIPAGTIAVIPHVPDDIVGDQPDDIDTTEDNPKIPPSTLLVAGQHLPRKLYPELSPIYAESGGFDYFALPYLIKKFIIGVDHETNEILWGDGVIYYETIPALEVISRDIRESL